MEHIHLMSVDSKDTRIQEDAFFIDSGTTGIPTVNLFIANIAAPRRAGIRKDILVENILAHSRYSGSEYDFLTKGDKYGHSLHPDAKKKRLTLIVRCTITADSILEEKVFLGYATSSPYSYESFMQSGNLATVKEKLKAFNAYCPEFEGVHETCSASNDSQRIIELFMSIFNRACSHIAYAYDIPTLTKDRNALYFGVQKDAKFNAPLRKGVSFINSHNLSSFLLGQPILYNEEKLRELGFAL